MHPVDLRKRVKNFFADAVAYILLIFGRAHIHEWQNGDTFLRWIGSAPSDRARGSVHKSSPNRDQAMVPASVVWAPAFQTLDESRKPDSNPGMADVRQAR